LSCYFPLPATFFFFSPGLGLAPQTAMFVVIPVVLEACLTSFFEVFKGTVLVFARWCALCNHTC
jgi:hypothetical protein